MLLLPAWTECSRWLFCVRKPGRNPLFIGNAFATLARSTYAAELHLVAIPYSSGMLLLLALAAGVDDRSYVAIPYSSGMLLLHHESTNQRCKVLFAELPVAIPYSSGMLLLLPAGICPRSGDNFWCNKVAIPYSSGMLLLPPSCATAGRTGGRRNPLFIGNAFATYLLFGVLPRYLNPPDQASQSPIHRECFCYPSSTPLSSAMTGKNSRNPLFIGNAFATSKGAEPKAIPAVVESQSPIHRECFCYHGTALDVRGMLDIGGRLSQSPIHRECFCYS